MFKDVIAAKKPSDPSRQLGLAEVDDDRHDGLWVAHA